MYMPIITFTRPSRLYSNVGVLKQLNHTYLVTQQNVAANGDYFQLFFMARGNETRFCIGTQQFTDCGIWDLYVNGVLDSAGYDDYAGASTFANRYILLTQSIRRGYNKIELKVNGKNASSTNYFIKVLGTSIQ